jgi:Fe-S cluster biogenesis protein NfuA/nitrite reductase/ring-hydroxylating ferredoxin subunit
MARVQALTEQLEEVQDFQARALADELVSSVIQLYGAGLERIFAVLDDDTRERLAKDGVVASLMLIHGMYPVPLEERVREALDSVRPYMESHGGNVEILAVENGVARLRLVGHCDNCPASSSTLELAIKKALEDIAPDLEGLEVEGVAERPPPPVTASLELPVIQSGGNGNGNGHGSGNGNGVALPVWTDLESDPPGPAATKALMVAGADVLVANVGGTLLAYRNSCGWCRSRLDDAPMTAGGTLTCPSCERRFELRRAGRSPDDDDLQIMPVPLLRGEGRVRVAAGA